MGPEERPSTRKPFPASDDCVHYRNAFPVGTEPERRKHEQQAGGSEGVSASRPSIQLRDRKKHEDEAVLEALEKAEGTDVDSRTCNEEVEITCTLRIIDVSAEPRSQA